MICDLSPPLVSYSVLFHVFELIRHKFRRCVNCAPELPLGFCVRVILLNLLIRLLFYDYTAGCQKKSTGSLGSNVLSDREAGSAILIQAVLGDVKWIK